MPTDEEKFVALMKEFEVELRADPKPRDGLIKVYYITAGSCPRVGGYTEFFSAWAFDIDGKFLRTDIWE